MIFVYGVVVGPGGTNICRVAGQTFPLLLLLNFLDVFPAQAPLETLVTERFRTEVTEIDLPTLAAPPKIMKYFRDWRLSLYFYNRNLYNKKY